LNLKGYSFISFRYSLDNNKMSDYTTFSGMLTLCSERAEHAFIDKTMFIKDAWDLNFQMGLAISLYRRMGKVSITRHYILPSNSNHVEFQTLALDSMREFFGLVLDEKTGKKIEPKYTAAYRLFHAEYTCLPVENNKRLAITKETAFVEEHLARYPVIWLTMLKVRGNYENFKGALKTAVATAFEQHDPLLKFKLKQCLLESFQPEQLEGKTIHAMIRLGKDKDLIEPELLEWHRYRNNDFNVDSELHNSIQFLSKQLHKHYGKKAVILVDEFDKPINHALTSGLSDADIKSIQEDMGAFLTATFKENPDAIKGTLTGLFYLNKGGGYSKFNPIPCSSINNPLARHFGFSPDETKLLMEHYNVLPQVRSEAQLWYNGYRMPPHGQDGYYNPFSIVRFCQDYHGYNLQTPAHVWTFTGYWANSASIEQLNGLYRAPNVRDTIFRLLNKGQTLNVALDQLDFNAEDFTRLFSLAHKSDLVVSEVLDNDVDLYMRFLFAAGYFTLVKGSLSGNIREITIPNEEVRLELTHNFYKWLPSQLTHDGDLATRVTDHLVKLLKVPNFPQPEDIDAFGASLADYLHTYRDVKPLIVNGNVSELHTQLLE
jgi:hypothetical protein